MDKITIKSFSSNYKDGYYDEIYDNANYKKKRKRVEKKNQFTFNKEQT